VGLFGGSRRTPVESFLRRGSGAVSLELREDSLGLLAIQSCCGGCSRSLLLLEDSLTGLAGGCNSATLAREEERGFGSETTLMVGDKGIESIIVGRESDLAVLMKTVSTTLEDSMSPCSGFTGTLYISIKIHIISNQ